MAFYWYLVSVDVAAAVWMYFAVHSMIYLDVAAFSDAGLYALAVEMYHAVEYVMYVMYMMYVVVYVPVLNAV